MNRIEFIQISNCKEKEVHDNFEHLMSMYEVANMYNSNSIDVVNTNNDLSLMLTYPSNERAKYMKERLDRIEVMKYNNKFKVETTINNNTINLKMNKVSG